MKMTRLQAGWIVLGVMLLLLNAFLLAHGPIVTASAEEQKRFQYKVIEVPPDTQQMEIVLNRYGQDGWELAAAAIGDLTMPRFVLKR
jgi:hypothetical protein